MMRKVTFYLYLGLFSILASCDRILEEKSDRSLATINTPEELQALLDYGVIMHKSYVGAIGDVASDNFFIPDNSYLAHPGEAERAMYVWDRVPMGNLYWTSYQRILNANTVIHYVDIMDMSNSQRAQLLGSALFFRAYSYWDLTQVYAKSYNTPAIAEHLGPVIKLSPDVNEPIVRKSLHETYEIMIDDLKQSIALLSPTRQTYPSRPNKPAAMAMLARLFLSVNDFESAKHYAASSLFYIDDLLDYNTVDSTIKYPFELFNEEVLFFSTHRVSRLTREATLRVDSNLYDSYAAADLRKKRFFTKQADGYYGFTGDYAQSSGDHRFNGLTTAEVWLIKAECAARLGNFNEALKTIENFRRYRYRTENHTELNVTDINGLLEIIYAERNKELVLRGVRWSDMRRLEDKFLGGQTVVRVIEGKNYNKTYQELRDFAFLIPDDVIQLSGIPQN